MNHHVNVFSAIGIVWWTLNPDFSCGSCGCYCIIVSLHNFIFFLSLSGWVITRSYLSEQWSQHDDPTTCIYFFFSQLLSCMLKFLLCLAQTTTATTYWEDSKANQLWKEKDAHLHLASAFAGGRGPDHGWAGSFPFRFTRGSGSAANQRPWHHDSLVSEGSWGLIFQCCR